MAHVSMVRKTSHRAIRLAAKSRFPARSQAKRKRSTRSVTVRVKSKDGAERRSKNQGSVRYGTLGPSKRKGSRSSGPLSKGKVRVQKREKVASSSLPRASKPARNLGLGNGSPSSEFLSAAQRLIGIKDGFLKKSFLRHLLAVSAIDVTLKAPQNVYAGLVFEHFVAKGYRVKSPRPGDLVFFATPFKANDAVEDRFTAAAVLEAIEPGGVYRCIGWVLGEVQRFKMDPRRPALRRDEANGERINDVIRGRSIGEGASKAALAGQLLVGFLRL
jgi:hypothetical protein